MNALTSSAPQSILIAGVGNVFLGDDAFGVAVARRMSQREMPEGVRVTDFGIRGFDLAYALAGEHDAAILVDATRRGGAPGTLYALEIDPAGEGSGEIETHAMRPANVLRLAAALGASPRRVLLVGCEPADGTPGVEREGMSAPVEAAVEGAIDLVLSLVARMRSGG